VTWSFVPVHLAMAWHKRLVELFGGAEGIRDIGLLEGALDRPRNLVAYEPTATVEQFAALYAVGLAKGHAFVDGNKRIAFAVMVAFLKAHGSVLDATEIEAEETMIGVADGSINEQALADWLRSRCRPEKSRRD
jgi:death on curing protein